MKNTLKLSALLFVVFAMGACTKWNQDPLADQDSLFSNPQEKPTNPEKGQPPESAESIRVDTVEFFVFNEGQPAEFNIAARVLRPDYKWQVQVENMSDFPGATFDEATGKFSWTVVKGTLPPSPDARVAKAMKIVAYDIDSGGVKRHYATKSIPIFIEKTMSTPSIDSVYNPDSLIREGTTSSFTVNVSDPDAPTDIRSYPSVAVYPIKGSPVNIAAFAQVTNTRMLRPGSYEVTVTVDLSNAEVTKGLDSTGFELRAVSAFGKLSSVRTYTVDVATSLGDLASTWFEPLEVKPGTKVQFAFMIFDPKDEVVISNPQFSGAPAGATVHCVLANRKQQCMFEYDVPADAVPGDRFSLATTVQISNQNTRDTYTRMQNLSFNVVVTGGF